MHLPAFSLCTALYVLPVSAHLMTNKLHCYEMNSLFYFSSSQQVTLEEGKAGGVCFSFLTFLQGAIVPVVVAEQHTSSQPSLHHLLAYSRHSVNPHRGLVT